jgi:hypothetical protein
MGFAGVKMKTAPKKLATPSAQIGEKEAVEQGPQAESLTGMKNGAATGCHPSPRRVPRR